MDERCGILRSQMRTSPKPDCTRPLALQSAEASRREAAGKMHLISTDLAVKLRAAATDYVNTDHHGGSNIDGQMPPR